MIATKPLNNTIPIAEILMMKFFVNQQLTSADKMRSHMLCMEIEYQTRYGETTLETIKKSQAYIGFNNNIGLDDEQLNEFVNHAKNLLHEKH